MSDVYLCSFASPSLDESVKRFEKEAKELNIYKNIKIYRKKDLSDEITHRIKNFNYPVKKMRLYGYACWKPQIVYNFFNQIPENSILQYTDIGCHFNVKGKNRLREYFELCKKKNILVFQYRIPEWSQKFEKLKFQQYFEYEYTKADTFEGMGIHNNANLMDTEQIWSGCFFIKKNQYGKRILEKWISLSENNNLISDDLSKSENHQKFIEHRHDQSIFSIICKEEKAFSLSASECEWAEKENKRTWEHLDNFPILAKRDKKFNVIKRFFNRQVRNFKRWFR